ncbi:MAG: hypothetical protein K6253_02115 [Candidatus Liberibacter asiaticus]|nr:hypothetical protein [Candidatus Liberibacter asiaticus]
METLLRKCYIKAPFSSSYSSFFFLQPNFFLFSKCMTSSKIILKNNNALVR